MILATFSSPGYGDVGAAAFFAFFRASFFARLAIPAESFFALSRLRRVVSILECVTWVRMVSVFFG